MMSNVCGALQHQKDKMQQAGHKQVNYSFTSMEIYSSSNPTKKDVHLKMHYKCIYSSLRFAITKFNTHLLNSNTDGIDILCNSI